MKRLLVPAAVTLFLASAWSDAASAQRHGFGGGARMGGGAFHGGGMRIGGGAFRGGGWGVAGGPGWGVASRAGWWRPGWAHAGWGRRWGFPLAVGVGLGSYGYASSYYSDCLSWDGYGWVNVCYRPYGYSYW
jgi:hypothetical protein